VFTDIWIRHILTGTNLSEEAVRRAIELSETRYCPAYAMLNKAASISSAYEIHPAGPAD
jgi:putative redox protein